MAIRIALAGLTGALLAQLATGSHLLLFGVELGAAAAIAARAVLVRRNRPVWTLAALGITQWAAAGVAWDLGWPVLSAVLLAGAFVSEYVGLCLFLRGRVRPFPVWLTVDGVLVAFTLAALGALAYAPVRAATHAAPHIVTGALVNLACDLLLLALILVGFAASSWRPGRAWWMAGAGLAVCAAGDVLFALRGVADGQVEGLWAASVVCIAFAAWQPTPPPTATRVGWSTAVLPLGAAALAITVALLCGLTGRSPMASLMAAGALLAALGRAVLMLRENLQLLHAARREAQTDKLTGLPNRRALLRRLERALADGRPHTLIFFDLDGFKGYNDRFGHGEGDALLRRLAARLATVGRAYRLGGDEFCLLTDGAPDVARAVAALSEGDITASHGSVALPDEAGTAGDALRLADERMYARKRGRRAGQADILLRMLAEHGMDQDRAVAFASAFSAASSAAAAPAPAACAPAGSGRTSAPAG